MSPAIRRPVPRPTTVLATSKSRNVIGAAAALRDRLSVAGSVRRDLVIPEGFNVFVPPYLNVLEYQHIDCIAELGKRGAVLGDSIGIRQKWAAWRGILEYVACVEYGRCLLHEVVKSKMTGGIVALAARYNAASLVFFGQAALDDVANWLSRRLSLKVKGSHCQLHKKGFQDALIEGTIKGRTIVDAVRRHQKFLTDLARYRQIWIHSLSGGANVYGDKSPAEGGIGFFAVPLDPAISAFPEVDMGEYARRIQVCRDANSGEWLEPLENFANRFTDGVKAVCLDMLTASLSCLD
jgi:hypothetical protein